VNSKQDVHIQFNIRILTL